MQKKGFTLQEVLIAVAIVGVVAAMIVPSVQKIMPDKTKVQYIKVYNTLTTQINDILDDQSLYWTTYKSDGTPECEGLTCRKQPVVAPYSTDNYCQLNTKLPAILAHRLNLAGDPTYPSTPNITPSTTTFKTTDGTEWRFAIAYFSLSNWYACLVDVTLSHEPNQTVATFSANNKDPLRFTFMIQKDGEVIPTDALGIVFLQNPTNFHSMQEDRDLATQIIQRTGDISTEATTSNTLNATVKKIQTLAANRQNELNKLKTSTSKT